MSLNRTVSDLQSRLRRPRRMKRLRERVVTGYLDLNQRIWQRLPVLARDASPVRKYGAHLHAVVSRNADREMYLGTLFLRNRPALELMRRLVEKSDVGSRLRVAVLGCSIGVEVYSILWILRSARPDLEIVVHAVDVSSEVLDVARRGAYSPEASDMVHASIFERLTKAEARGDVRLVWAGGADQALASRRCHVAAGRCFRSEAGRRSGVAGHRRREQLPLPYGCAGCGEMLAQPGSTREARWISVRVGG